MCEAPTPQSTWVHWFLGNTSERWLWFEYTRFIRLVKKTIIWPCSFIFLMLEEFFISWQEASKRGIFGIRFLSPSDCTRSHLLNLPESALLPLAGRMWMREQRLGASCDLPVFFGPQLTPEGPWPQFSRKGPQVSLSLVFQKALQGHRHLLDTTPDKDSWANPQGRKSHCERSCLWGPPGP